MSQSANHDIGLAIGDPIQSPQACRREAEARRSQESAIGVNVRLALLSPIKQARGADTPKSEQPGANQNSRPAVFLIHINPIWPSFTTIQATGEISMYEHPILGAILFVIGAVLIAAALAAGNGGDTAGALIAGHILAFNGALLAALGTGRHAPANLRARRVFPVRLTHP